MKITTPDNPMSLQQTKPLPRDAWLERWVAQIQSRGAGPLAVFLLRAHLPLTGFMAHALMFGEPFLKMFNVQSRPLYELFNDRDAVQTLINTLENNE